MPAKASGVLTLDTAPFIKSLEAAKIALKGFAVAVGAIALTAVAGFAVLGVGLYKIISSFKDGLVAAYQFGKEMNSAARQIQGVGVGNFFLIQKALEKSGMSAEEARSSMKQMSETGLSWDKLWKTPKDAATAIAAAKEDFGPMATALDKGAKAVSALKNIIDSLSMKFATFFQAFLAGIVEPLKIMLKAIEGAIDLSKLGTKLGDKLGMVMTQWIGGIADGNIGEVLGAQLKLAWIALTKEIDKFFKEAGAGLDFSGKIATVFSAAGSLIVSLLTGAFKEGAYLLRDVLNASFKVLGGMLGINRTGANAAQEVKIQDEAIRILKREKEYDMLNTQAGGANKQAEFDEKIKQALVEKDRLQAISNYESGKGGLNTPAQNKIVQDYLSSKGENTTASDTLSRADTVKEIKEKTAALMEASKAAGGIVGQIGAQLGGVAKALAGTEAAARKTLADAEVSGIIAGELYKKNNPDVTAPPLGQVKPMEIISGSLAKIGGSGGVFQMGQDIVTQNATQTKINTANTVGLLKENNVYLKKIAEKTSAVGGVVGP